MAIDPSLYVFNDQYISHLVDKYIFQLKNKLYYRSLEVQNNYRNTLSMKEYSFLLSNSLDFLMSNSNDMLKYGEDKFINNAYSLYGTLSDFSINVNINKEYGFSESTLSLSLDGTYIIPYYNKKKFLDNYGHKSVLSLLDVMADYTTFNSRLLFSIDKYIFLMLKIIILKERIILVIEDDNVNGISSDVIRTLTVENKIWCLYSENQSDYYYTYKIKTSLFTTGRNVISMNQISTKKEFNKPDKINSYNILITASSTNPNLLAQSTATLGLDLDGVTKCFTVSSSYKNYIMSNSNNCYCYIFNNYRKTGYSIINDLSDDEKIMMQIPYTKNPISFNNINIWEYDSVNDITLEKIKNEMVQSFPNLYDLSYLTRNIDYYIDWYAVNVSHIEFDNNIKEYMECYSDSYIEMMINETAPEILLNYTPITNFIYDYDDYIDKIDNGDIREYNIIKLKELLADDGNRYFNFAKNINIINKKYIRDSYDMSTYPSIYNRTVMSNSEQILHSGDLVSFSEPHIYITFSNSTNDVRTAILYIDGKRYVPTFVYTENYKTYVYIKKSLLTSSSKIIVEIPILNASSYNKLIGEFLLSEVNSEESFPDIFERVSGNNLVFYNSSTLDYYSKDLFNLVGNIDLTFLITNDDRNVIFVAPDDDTLLVTSDLVFDKNIPTDNLFIASPNSDILNTNISVTNTDTLITVDIPNIETSHIGTFSNFKEDPSEDRFRVYINGVLVDESSYTYTPPSKYMDDAVFEIDSYAPILETNSALIEYLPYKEKTLIDSQLTTNKVWWREIEISDMSLDIKFIVYGKGKFIIVPDGETNIYYVSDNGNTWTPYTLPITKTWEGIYFINDKFIIFGYRSPSSLWLNQPDVRIYSSEDGITWVGNINPPEGVNYDVWDHDSEWVDDPEHSVYITDNIGGIWDGREINSLYPIRSMIYTNNLYIAVSDNKIMYSEDSFNWSIASFQSSSYLWKNIAYGNGKFVIVSDSYDKVAISIDGITWIESDIPFTTSSANTSIVFGNGKFIISGYSDSYISESVDGIIWIQRNIPHSVNKGKIVYGNKKYSYISSDNLYTVISTDAITWDSFELINTKSYNNIAYGKGMFLCIGYSPENNNIATFSYGNPILYYTNLLDLTILTDNPFDKDNAKIYVNGLRISNDDIVETKFLNVIKINGYTSSDTIRIDVIHTDRDCYNYGANKSNLLYNKLISDDPIFSSYINDNY